MKYSISTDENYMTEIICEKAKFSISGRSGEEFPSLPEVRKRKSYYSYLNLL